MRECDSSSKAANLTRRFGSSAPGFWREPFASSATTSPSPPETQLQPKWGYKCSGGDFRRCSEEQLVDALTGRPEPMHRAMLGLQLERLQLIDRQIAQLNGMIAQ